MTALHRLNSHEDLTRAGSFFRDSDAARNAAISDAALLTNIRPTVDPENDDYDDVRYLRRHICLAVNTLIVLVGIQFAFVFGFVIFVFSTDWHSLFGLDSIQQQLTLGTAALLKYGPLLDNITRALPLLEKCSALLTYIPH